MFVVVFLGFDVFRLFPGICPQFMEVVGRFLDFFRQFIAAAYNIVRVILLVQKLFHFYPPSDRIVH